MREKYNFTKDESAEYKTQYLKELKKEVLELLDELDESGLIRLDQFMKSQTNEERWEKTNTG